MSKRKYFLKLEAVAPNGTVFRWTMEEPFPQTPEMEAAFRRFMASVQRLANKSAEQHKRLKGPRMGVVSIADVAAAPGMRMDAGYHLDRLEDEAQDKG